MLVSNSGRLVVEEKRYANRNRKCRIYRSNSSEVHVGEMTAMCAAVKGEDFCNQEQLWKDLQNFVALLSKEKQLQLVVKEYFSDQVQLRKEL